MMTVLTIGGGTGNNEVRRQHVKTQTSVLVLYMTMADITGMEVMQTKKWEGWD